MKNIFYLALGFLLLTTCGAENLPRQLEKMDETANKTIEGMEESNRNMERLLDHCFEIVFAPDIVSPLDSALPAQVQVPTLQFNEEIKEPQVVFVSLQTSQLSLYLEPKSQVPYYRIPEYLKDHVIPSALKKFPKQNSLCQTVDTILSNKVESYQEQISTYIADNEDVFIEKLSQFIIKIENAKIDCEQYEVERAIQDYLDSQIKWWEFRQLKKLKRRKKIEEIKNQLNPHPCVAKKKSEETLDEEETSRLKSLIDERWSQFFHSWVSYYKNWKEDKKLIFDHPQRLDILTLSLEDTRLLTLYQLKNIEVANKLKLLDLAKPVFPLKDPVKLRKFLANNEKGMSIDPDVEVDYLKTPIDRIEILQQIFERYFYSGNTKAEKNELRLFITDAIFMLYEQQLIQLRIEPNQNGN
ncbi:MAG: hypothetical protein H6621_09480 [Halobacteriovoraceae bacterium]|nr:hypothetical protein [Halobacteriovoraceae bacterium]MCB9095287.1 hypothetical protein [Halobacteriovoraceae bacterium]